MVKEYNMAEQKQDNAKAIKAKIQELHDLIAEENGWEPKTSRDYSILTWAFVKELRDDIKVLENLPGRVGRLEWVAALIGTSLVGLAAKLIFGS